MADTKPLIMKKAVVTLMMFLAVGYSISYASEVSGVDPRIETAFKKDFSFAENVKWEQNGELARVSFSFNDQGFYAWYNKEAELVTTARNILYMQLPLSIIKSLEDKYPNSSLSGIVEYTKDGETFYHLQTEKKGRKLLLKATPSGNLTVIKKIK